MARKSPDKKYVHSQWSSHWAFILAASGCAVGLGNVWRFPYLAGENGGGAFVLVYLLTVALIGIPIMMAEVMLGRRARQSPVNAMRTLAATEGTSRHWQYLGWLGIVGGFVILSYYSVIAGWTLAYIFRVGSGQFALSTGDSVRNIFAEFVGDPERLLAWHTLFMLMTAGVVARGVQSGLEQANRVMMPALFVLLLVLIGYAMHTDHFGAGLAFLFSPDFDRLTGAGVIAAMGQAFFSLGLGMGAIMIYGSYMPKTSSIVSATFTVALTDTLVAVLAGVAIFPLVFANGLAPAGGPSLVFQALPLAFGQMPGGAFFGALFFILLVFAAWTSSISLMEPAVAWLVERHGFIRWKASAWVGVAAWLLGIVSILSFNRWAFAFDFLGARKSSGLFDLLDILTANIMLPVSGILICVFSGWVMRRAHSREELDIRFPRGYNVWLALVKYVSPVLVFLVLLNLLNVFNLF